MITQNTSAIDSFIAVMHNTDRQAAREEILLATLRMVRSLQIGAMAALIIDEGLADYAKFLPEVVA